MIINLLRISILSYLKLFKKEQKTIISPDVDGLLCGLLMSNYLDWEIVGFYDGKLICFDRESNISECVFLDV